MPKDWITSKKLSKDKIIGDIDKRASSKLKLSKFCEHVAFVSQVKPKNVNDAFVSQVGLLLCKMNLINSLEMMCGV